MAALKAAVIALFIGFIGFIIVILILYRGKIKRLQEENDRILEDATKRPPRTAPVTEKNLEAYGFKIYPTKDCTYGRHSSGVAVVTISKRWWITIRTNGEQHLPQNMGEVYDFITKANET